MALVPDGVYQISNNVGCLTLYAGSKEPGAQVNLLPSNGGKDPNQSWRVQNQESTAGNGETVTIQNVASGTYLSYDGSPDTLDPLRGFPDTRQWQVQMGPDAGQYLLVAPDNFQGMLVADTSLFMIYPPMAALVPLREASRQDWTFQPVK